MPRGRPVRSEIRKRILEILFILGQGYGYQVAKAYNEIFPEVSQRSIYYHLKKGLSTGEIEIGEVREENGDFSWGSSVEKTYYKLGPTAHVKGMKRVQKYFKGRNEEKNKTKSK